MIKADYDLANARPNPYLEKLGQPITKNLNLDVADDEVVQGWLTVERTREALGISVASSNDQPSDDELLAEALLDRMSERASDSYEV